MLCVVCGVWFVVWRGLFDSFSGLVHAAEVHQRVPVLVFVRLVDETNIDGFPAWEQHGPEVQRLRVCHPGLLQTNHAGWVLKGWIWIQEVFCT